MRVLWIVGLFFSTLTSLFANSYEVHPLYEERRNKLLGIYGSYTKEDADSKINLDGQSQTHGLDEKHMGFGIQAGYLLNENHRILLDFAYHLKKNGFAYSTFTIGYAFTPKLPTFDNWRAIFGVNAGLAMAKFSQGSFNIGGSSMGDLTFNGVTYGVKAGLLYALPYGELEFGIAARRLDFGDESDTLMIEDKPINANLDLSITSSLGAYFGYNYLF